MKQNSHLFVIPMGCSVWNGVMCDKCVEIDEKIKRFENIVRSISDQPTIDGAKRLIAELQAQKAVLHPQREQ